MLLVAPEPGRSAGPLPERSLSGRQQDVDRQLGQPVGREEGMDEGGVDLPTETHV